MSLKDHCTEIIVPGWVTITDPSDPLYLDPLGQYLDPNSTQTLADELQHIIDSTSHPSDSNATNLDDGTQKARNAERILVKRQDLRRIAYVDQLIKDAKHAIMNISNLRVDLDNYTGEAAADAVNILEGKESDIIEKLRNAISYQFESETDLNQVLNYVKAIL